MNDYYDEFLAEYVLNSVQPELITMYHGTDFPPDASIGSVCLKNDTLYINTQQDNPQWEILATAYSEPEVKYLKPELAICECCGAPLHGDRCEYCDSTYIWR